MEKRVDAEPYKQEKIAVDPPLTKTYTYSRHTSSLSISGSLTHTDMFVRLLEQLRQQQNLV